MFLAKGFGYTVDAFDHSSEFVEYSNRRSDEQGLQTTARFSCADVNGLQVARSNYDIGACLGALYIFRENGWRLLSQGTKPGGYLAVSDLVCKKTPAPKEILDLFFEPDQPLTLEETRQWYTSRGARILLEIACSEKAWIEYYDLKRKMLDQISKQRGNDMEFSREVEEELRQDRFVRRYREEYVDYITFIMQKA